MIEWLVYFFEYACYLLRLDRDERLGRHVDRLTHRIVYFRGPLHQAAYLAKMASRHVSLMSSLDFRERHQATITRTGL